MAKYTPMSVSLAGRFFGALFVPAVSRRVVCPETSLINCELDLFHVSHAAASRVRKPRNTNLVSEGDLVLSKRASMAAVLGEAPDSDTEEVLIDPGSFHSRLFKNKQGNDIIIFVSSTSAAQSFWQAGPVALCLLGELRRSAGTHPHVGCDLSHSEARQHMSSC